MLALYRCTGVQTFYRAVRESQDNYIALCLWCMDQHLEDCFQMTFKMEFAWYVARTEAYILLGIEGVCYHYLSV